MCTGTGMKIPLDTRPAFAGGQVGLHSRPASWVPGGAGRLSAYSIRV